MHRWWSSLVALLVLALAACAARRADTNPAAPSSAAQGLEVAWWVVRQPTDAAPPRRTIGQIVAAHALPADLPVDEETLRLWRANGLRLVVVPSAKLDAIRRDLQSVGSTEHQWIAPTGIWKPAFRGTSWESPATLRLDNGPLELSPGALRAMVRGWVVPVEPPTTAQASTQPAANTADSSTPAAGLQLELALQHHERRRPVSDLQAALSIDSPKTLSDDGLVFWRLALTATLAPGRSYIILAEDPDKEWATNAIQRLIEANPPPTPDAEPPTLLGPVPPATPTLGEALLTDALRARRAQTALLILTPRVPERFELLPR